jgi:predicted ATPase
VAAQQQLLFLDELHITDVADAMVLGRLFGGLLVRGCWLVFTSNRPARALYKGGLNRKYLEPFIHLLHAHLLHLKVASGVDYRRKVASSSSSSSGGGSSVQQQMEQTQEQGWEGSVDQQGALPGWLWGQGADAQLEEQWEQHLATCGSKAGPVQLQLPYGRTLSIPAAVEPLLGTHSTSQQHQSHAAADSTAASGTCSAAAWFTFDQLFGPVGCSTNSAAPSPLAAPEYLAIARRFPRLYISGIPQLQVAQRDEARRLVTLVDILYDARCKGEPQAGHNGLLGSCCTPPCSH